MNKSVRVIALLLGFVGFSPAAGQAQVAAPLTDDPELQEIFKKAYWYTEAEMPKVYQQDVRQVRTATFHDVYYKIGPDPFGYANGNREWPWSDPSTLADDDRNVTNAVGMVLPSTQSGKTVPIVVYRTIRNTPLSNKPTVSVLAWKFPVGTEFVEIVCNRVAGEQVPFKVLRATKNRDGGWDRKAYRPFTTLQEYVNAIGKTIAVSKPRFATLQNRHPLKKKFEAMVLKLPAQDQQLVSKLLKETPFNECLGKPFHEEALVSAPTSDHAGQIVPKGYVGNFFARNDNECQQCHKDVLTHTAYHEIGRDWYGFIRGSDQIFSFHPIDMRSVARRGSSIQPKLNPELVRKGWVKNRDDSDDPAMYGGFQ